MTATTIGAILLVGGRSTRMGGGAKPLLEVGGRTLLSRAIGAMTDAGCAPIIAVGPQLDSDAPVRWAREDPPFSGPAAGIAAGVSAQSGHGDGDAPEWTLVLAGDLPHVERVTAQLTGAATSAPSAADAVVLSAGGHPQWLAGIYRTAALRAAVRAAGDELAGLACRALLGGLDITWLADEDGITADIDTPADLARMRAAFEEETVSESSRTLPPEALDEWALALRERFDLDAEDVPIGLILDLARDVANGVARPAAPFSAFVAGLVAGRAGGTPQQVREAVAAVVELAGDWKER
ncbi:NTP transferase domain-containing protein [Microbacterium sp. nov. GSS16]|uniref:NTP transferase domain-containing protein n=1 Tax=Microbacterium sp. nov. GSS16 TaxID=3019890 RepID=UPI002304F7F7|nr:NTP transferase domain-containing protein [Microbacterium sp. nov. GSS16]WCD93795.1 NTP transferase domain-containing protein [Microbacterium sp. nov. GSS16]